MRRRDLAGATLAAGWLAGCVSVDLGADAGAAVQLALRDSGTAPERRASPVVDALLIQALPGDSLVDTMSIVYSRREHEYSAYRLATWTDRPLRTLPRLLQRRLEARGVAGAVGLQGDPLRADWLLTLAVEALVHEVAVEPGRARLAFGADLYDRRQRVRVAQRRFTASAPAARADAASAAAAMSSAVAQAFDELVPWLEGELLRATGRPGQPAAAVN